MHIKHLFIDLFVIIIIIWGGGGAGWKMDGLVVTINYLRYRASR